MDSKTNSHLNLKSPPLDPDRAERMTRFEESIDSNPYFFCEWKKCFTAKLDPPMFLKKVCSVSSHLTASEKESLESEYSEFATMAYVVGSLIEAFVQAAYNANETESKETLQSVTKYTKDMNEKGFPVEYLEGVEYLHYWMIQYMSLRQKELPSEDIKVAQFESMSARGRALVLGVKAVFIGGMSSVCPVAMKLSCQTMEEVVKLDPTAFNWHYRLGNWLRFRRRQLGERNSRPSGLELQTVWDTFAVCEYRKKDENGSDTSLRKMALAGLLQALAEIVRFRRFEGCANEPLSVGTLTFDNEQDIVSFINWHLEQYTGDNVTFAEYIRAGEILANILPFDIRNYDLALKFFQEAYNIAPGRSKACHKLGNLYLASEKHRDMSQALRYFGEALRADCNNFPAAIDYMKILVGLGNDKAQEFAEVFESQIESHASSKQKAQLYFVAGCSEFINESKQETVSYLSQSYWADSEQCIASFQELLKHKPINRYCWDSTKINFGQLLRLLSISVKSLQGMEKEAVENILTAFPRPEQSHQSRNYQRQHPNDSRTTGIFSRYHQGRRNDPGPADLDNHWRAK